MPEYINIPPAPTPAEWEERGILESQEMQLQQYSMHLLLGFQQVYEREAYKKEIMEYVYGGETPVEVMERLIEDLEKEELLIMENVYGISKGYINEVNDVIVNPFIGS